MTIESVLPFMTGSLLSYVFNYTIPDSIIPYVTPGTYINVDVPNDAFAKYGVGIGELFICVGMFVGCIAMVTVLDRRQRVKTTNSKV
jgi:type III secretory pathway component EscT